MLIVFVTLSLQSNKKSLQVSLREELQNVTEAEKPHAVGSLERLNLWSLTIVVVNVVSQLDPATFRNGFTAARNNVFEEFD